MTDATTPKPIWDRGDPIDAEMLAFTTGDDPLLDRRLVEHDLVGVQAVEFYVGEGGQPDALGHL